MFGYVTPCKMELKIKDYEKFKAYYCGLCKTIKSNYGNLPRVVLNYDMTFLAILLHSLDDDSPSYIKKHCIVHPMRKKIIMVSNPPLEYAAFCNITLAYFKLLDNVNDDKSIKSKLLSILLKVCTKKTCVKFANNIEYIEKKLDELYSFEKNKDSISIDEISHPFGELTGYILSSYIEKDNINSEILYNLGYNLGKWIYIIDAWDDLEKDMNEEKYNPINFILNKDNKNYKDFSREIEERIDFILTMCGRHCLDCLSKLHIKKNEELLYNILQYGLMEKMDKVFKGSDFNYDKSI